jgi:uncharacterized protein (DUF4415 family)
MKENNKSSSDTWVDPDEAAELDDHFFENAVPMVADKPVTKDQFKAAIEHTKKGRPKSLNPKQPVTIRLSSEVTEYFRSTGKGWQTRINEVLSEYVASH